ATSTGLGLRMVEGRLTVTRLLPGFPAEKAGVKTGFVVNEIGGSTVSDFEGAKLKLSGTAGTAVRVSFLDENDRPREFVLERQGLGDKDRGDLAGLNFYALFDSRRLDGGIGYMWFSSFVPFLNDRIRTAM